MKTTLAFLLAILLLTSCTTSKPFQTPTFPASEEQIATIGAIIGEDRLRVTIAPKYLPTATNKPKVNPTSTQIPNNEQTIVQTVKPADQMSTEEKEEFIFESLELFTYAQPQLTKVLTRYLEYVNPELFGDTVFISVDKMSIDEEDAIEIAFLIIANTAMFTTRHPGGDWGLRSIEVYFPGPAKSSITFYLKGRDLIKRVGDGDIDLVWDEMKPRIDFGEMETRVP